MREEYLVKVPEWYRSFEKFDVVLSDCDTTEIFVDCDSLKNKPSWY